MLQSIRFLYKGRHYVVKKYDEKTDEIICYWVADPRTEYIFKVTELEKDENFKELW